MRSASGRRTAHNVRGPTGNWRGGEGAGCVRALAEAEEGEADGERQGTAGSEDEADRWAGEAVDLRERKWLWAVGHQDLPQVSVR